MKRLVIDRFEGKYAICEDDEQKSFAIETAELPEGAKAGSVLEISEEGELSVNDEETAKARARINEKQRKLFES